MADLFHWFGNDLQAAPNGDLLTVEGTVKGQQLVIRRLLTVVQSYIWQLNYGAGLAQYIGTDSTGSTIEGVIRAQLYLESAVSQSPIPNITIAPISNGINVFIQYVDAQTGAPATLNFNVKS